MRKKFDKKNGWKFGKYFTICFLVPEKNSLLNIDMKNIRSTNAKRDNSACMKSNQSV